MLAGMLRFPLAVGVTPSNAPGSQGAKTLVDQAPPHFSWRHMLWANCIIGSRVKGCSPFGSGNSRERQN